MSPFVPSLNKTDDTDLPGVLSQIKKVQKHRDSTFLSAEYVMDSTLLKHTSKGKDLDIGYFFRV